MSYSIRPLEGSGRTVTLVAGVPWTHTLTDRESLSGLFVLQVSTAIKVMVTWGDPAPAPDPATPGTPRLEGPGVWFQDTNGLTVAIDVPPGTPVTDVEIYFGSAIRSQQERVSWFGVA